jgi:hypothetical protein
MNIPGFTAEATLQKRSGLYSNRQMAVIGVEARIVPALRISLYSPRQVQAACKKLGGSFWPAGSESNTYGCVTRNGNGVVCGGDTEEHQNSCDTF